MSEILVPVGVSNRHAHISQKDLETLFGVGYKLTEMKPLTQPGQYAANETITLVGPKGSIDKVRILGPVRPASQVEVSLTDSFKLGVKIPVRESGKIEGSGAIKLVGPKGEVDLTEGLVAALRHIHMPLTYANENGFKDQDVVSVSFDGERATVFNNVLVRASDAFALEFHLDTDEANGAGIGNGAKGKVVR